MNGDYRVIRVLIHLPVSDHMSLQGTCIVVVLISDRCVMETARHFTFFNNTINAVRFIDSVIVYEFIN
jgi:hypothetical protein